ncbi:MAG TPA: hypothetical protein VLT59_15455 [Steroidobacteraceae bacterium]|nr:hypothetical protein [Steroidobacteraceae bacterium]
MRYLIALALTVLLPLQSLAQSVDPRPPDRLILLANGSRIIDSENGAGGSINWVHYLTPDATLGIGGEYQEIGESEWAFGILRGSYGWGEPGSRVTVYGELNAGQGDESGRDYDYLVAALGVNKAFTTRFSAQLETRQIEIDRTHGNLPKLALSYLITPRLLGTVSYANSVGGNLGTEITIARLDYYGAAFGFFIGGATGQADPSVVNLPPGVTLPSNDLNEGFIGVRKTFDRGEIQLVGDYLDLGDSEKVTVTLSYTAYLGSRGRGR